ncbi:unnamed protein product [Darwinula stevensoni]|uniref:Uncharacterized protein n=1 Tax=Darwinula stevensoni TaxID=69355 RepID=A0A7R9A495_9CRUS|nr:unnamed protein product [Darwinula stevensoni]CAG0893196.1 unnamed protein product [Darwinula stevensoni]
MMAGRKELRSRCHVKGKVIGGDTATLLNPIEKREEVKKKAKERVLSWLCQKGEETLARFKVPADNLTGVRHQERHFDEFYFVAMKHIEKGQDLLSEEEGIETDPSGPAGIGEVTKSLKLHLHSFGERLEATRERLEDTSRVYNLLERVKHLPPLLFPTSQHKNACPIRMAYEWAMETMKFAFRWQVEDQESGLEPIVTALSQLDSYLSEHPPITEETFSEMLSLAQKLESSKILEQVKIAEKRCQETQELLEVQREALLKSKHQYESRIPCLPSEDGDQPGTKVNRGLLDWDLLRFSGAKTCPTCDPLLALPSPIDSSSAKWNSGKSWCVVGRRSSLQSSSGCGSDLQPDESEDGASKDESGFSFNEDLTYGIEEGRRESRITGSLDGDGDGFGGPVPVNSHLLSRGSSLNLSVSLSGAHGQDLNDKDKKTLLMIMKEMIQTERDYVKALAYIIEELEHCETTPFNAGLCFLRYESQFYLYALYNKNKPKSDSLMSEYGAAFFKKKQRDLGDKMDLASYLLKPVQRMGKYALLLKQLLKECPSKMTEHAELSAAEEMVRFQLRHGNDLLAMDSLRECDVSPFTAFLTQQPESMRVNLKEQGRLLRQDEFLVHQGKGKKALRQVFLFEDLILFSKAKRDPERKNLDLYLYKHSIKTTDIGLTENMNENNTRFEIWFRKRKPNDTYTLQAPSSDVKLAWTEEISKLLWRQALRNREMRLVEMSSMGIGNKPCLDIKPSEDQIHDRLACGIAYILAPPRLRSCQSEKYLLKRPYSIISVSSSGSSSSSSGHSCINPPQGSLNLGFDPNDSESPRLHRSITLHSQCSNESGIIADISATDCGASSSGHSSVHRSNSSATTTSLESTATLANLPSPSMLEAPLRPQDALITEVRLVLKWS